VNYYINAEEQLEGAEVLAASGKYRLAVTLLSLSCELFLKSLAESKDPMNPLLDSHDIVGLGHLIRNDVDYKAISPKLTFMRKYLNDSRYPFDAKAYTKELYEECHVAVLAIKHQIDSANAKKSNIERLSERFGSENVTEKPKK
jgi:HEPN domain-containing protein